MRRLKWVGGLILLTALLLAAALAVRELRGCGGPPRGTAPASPDEKIPPSWEAPPVARTSPWTERLRPWHRPTEADRLLAGWPAGSKVVTFETPRGERGAIAITPQGTVAIRGNDPIVYRVYERPKPTYGVELRPYLGGGMEAGPSRLGPVAAGGLDLLYYRELHGGPAAWGGAGSVAGGAALGWNVWGNVDLRLAGGYGTGGPSAAALVTVALR